MYEAKEIAITVIGSGVAGSLLTLAVKWGINLKGLSTLGQSHEKLKYRFVNHETNTRIHRDPDRDPKNDDDLKSHMDKNFHEIKETMNKIDNRCEKRGEECARHFAQVETKIAFSNGIREASRSEPGNEVHPSDQNLVNIIERKKGER